MSGIDDYLKNVEPTHRAELERVRGIIKDTVPEIEEKISWGMPTFKYLGRNLIHFAAFKDHMSLFPGAAIVEDFKDQLEGYQTSKGTVQFTVEHPIPESIIKEIVQNRLAVIKKGSEK